MADGATSASEGGAGVGGGGGGGAAQGFSATEIILSEVVAEAEAAVAAARQCARSLRLAELEAAGQAGLALHVFACLTCAAEARRGPVGVCEACALACHVTHEVVDVGLRHDWLCDCRTPGRCAVACVAVAAGEAAAGEAAAGEAAAEAEPPAAAASSSAPAPRPNVYGHNFEGRFCECDRPYAAAVDTLTQCLCCAEWLHPAHIPGWLPGGDAGRVVCRRCVAARPFLTPFAVRGDRGRCSGGAAEAALQPWRVCLTCTEGADDGRGVCMACADTCHAGHVLGRPRVSEFFCDCAELCKACTLTAPAAAEAPAAPAAAAAAALQPTAAAAAAEELAAPAPAPAPASPETLTTAPPSPATVALAPRWCAAQAAAAADLSAGEVVPDVAIFIDDIEALIAHLCPCAACMNVYAAAGVASWFFAMPDWLPIAAPAAPAAGAGGAAPAAHASEVITALRQRGAAEAAASRSPASTAALSRLTELAPLLPAGFKTSFEQGITALGSLPTAEQVTALQGYNDMSTSVMRWLESHSASGRATVTAEDVRAFFASLDSERRVRRRYNDGDE